MKKLIPVAALSGLLFVIGFISISVRNTNNAFAAPPCSSCQKAADSGKKQSPSKKICSAITGILKNEIGKTKNKTKLDILKGGLDYANDVCDSGGSPDLAKITKGLPEKDKARISQKTNAALFDGVADRPDKDFGPNTSKTAATLTGTGGQVTDLKSSEPSTPKFSQVTEFSLASAKTAQASTAKASAASPCPPNEQLMDCKCPFENKSFGMKCSLECYRLIDTQCSVGGNVWDKFLNWAWSNKTIKRYLESIETVGNWIAEKEKAAAEWVSDKYHEWIKGEKKCGKTYYKEDKQCCAGNKLFAKCGGHCVPPSEYAVSKALENCPAGFYCREYYIYFTESQDLNLAGVNAYEHLKNKQQVDSRPLCHPGLPEDTSYPLEKGPNGLFRITDTLGMRAPPVKPCAHKYEQEVKIGGCLIQTNTLTFEANSSGVIKISRSDELKK